MKSFIAIVAILVAFATTSFAVEVPKATAKPVLTHISSAKKVAKKVKGKKVVKKIDAVKVETVKAK